MEDTEKEPLKVQTDAQTEGKPVPSTPEAPGQTEETIVLPRSLIEWLARVNRRVWALQDEARRKAEAEENQAEENEQS